VDIAFYDNNTLSMLLTETHEDGCAVLLQLPLAVLEQTTWSRTSTDSLKPLLQQTDVWVTSAVQIYSIGGAASAILVALGGVSAIALLSFWYLCFSAKGW